MPLTIGSNIDSLRSQRRLSEGTADLSKTFERLSSGMRINRASDDAAGLAISESLRTDRRVFNQAVRNLNDGVSLLAIADSAVDNLSGIVIRLKELAEQSANGTFGLQQRKSLDAEAQALSKEYFRISRSVEFNGLSLFTGSLGDLRLQAGYGTDGSILSGLGGAIGTGNFQGSTSYAAFANAAGKGALGDINGDGTLDLVTVGMTAGITAFVGGRLGTGDGTFGAEVSYHHTSPGSVLINAVALGDLNGDGTLDIVASGNPGYTILLGHGDGSFTAGQSYAGGASNAMTLGDLNGDGILDLVLAGQTGSDGYAAIQLGKGDGSFGPAISYAAESGGSNAVTLGDLNGDGIPDLITAGFADGNSGYVTIRLGTGDGTFGASNSYATGGNAANSVVVGDMNGDGRPDLATVGNDGYAAIFLGAGNGTFAPAVSYAMQSTVGFSVALADLNGDGTLDLVSGGYRLNGIPTHEQIVIRLGHGDGSFASAILYEGEMNSSASSILTGDLNRDGVPDLTSIGSGRIRVRAAATTEGIQPLLPFTLTSRADALQALSVFDQKLNQLSQQRGIIGAFQSRIAAATNVLQATAENYDAAAGRIRDADMADESSRLVRTQTLQQAASAVLAQANLQPSLALALLREN